MSTANYTIRDARAEDAEAIISMHAQSWLDVYPNAEFGVSYEWVKHRTEKWVTPQNVAKRRERIKRALRDPDLLYKIAVTDIGEVVGIACPIRDENEQRVGGLYVNKQHYGTGLAQKLMDEILAWADPRRSIELEVATYNERAKAFYRKYGFKEIPNSQRYYHSIPVVKMIRRGGAA